MDLDETITDLDLKGVLTDLPQQGTGEPDLWVDGWNTSLGARLLRLFRNPD